VKQAAPDSPPARRRPRGVQQDPQAAEDVRLPTGVPGAQVTQHFAPIHALMAGEAGAAPIDRLVEQIKQLQERLEPVGSGIGQEVGDAAGRGARRNRWQDAGLPDAVGSLIAGSGTCAGRVSRRTQGITDRVYPSEVVSQCTLPSRPLSVRDGRRQGRCADQRLWRIFSCRVLTGSTRIDRLVDNCGPVVRADVRGGRTSQACCQFERAQESRDVLQRRHVPGSSSPSL
jgi:hypothetical protein